MELAVGEAVRAGSEMIETEHLLLGLLRDGSNMAVRLLTTAGVDVKLTKEDMLAINAKLNKIKKPKEKA